LAVETASALSLPACTCGMTASGARLMICVSPCSTLVTAAGDDAYGTCTTKLCVSVLSISTLRCDRLPTPIDA
jgi:hypothetical protein